MGSFQVYAMPVFDMMETLLVKNGFSNSLPYRLLVRSAYVIAVGFFAITLPFFGSLLGFLGMIQAHSSLLVCTQDRQPAQVDMQCQSCFACT